MFASLHRGTSIIRNFSEAADPHSTIDCFRKLGVNISVSSDNQITVDGVGREGMEKPTEELDCGNSGTTMRLLSGIIAGSGISAQLTGDESLSSRTMRRVIDPLENMGANIEARKGDFAPLQISRNGVIAPLHFPLPIPSAQLKSCVLLAGLFGEGPTEVVETLPSRDHTERLLELPFKKENGTKVIQASQENSIPEQSYRIPNDFSSAAFWLTAGAIHPNAEIYLPGVGLNPSRTGALDILKEMGAEVMIENEHMEGNEPSGDLIVRSSTLQPTHITEEVIPNCIDEITILAMAMLYADGRSRVSGAEELRHKETDRLHALAHLLEKAGANFTEYEDGFVIEGNPDFVPNSAIYKSFHDHRIAMAAGVLSLMSTKESTIQNADCTGISYP